MATSTIDRSNERSRVTRARTGDQWRRAMHRSSSNANARRAVARSHSIKGASASRTGLVRASMRRANGVGCRAERTALWRERRDGANAKDEGMKGKNMNENTDERTSEQEAIFAAIPMSELTDDGSGADKRGDDGDARRASAGDGGEGDGKEFSAQNGKSNDDAQASERGKGASGAHATTSGVAKAKAKAKARSAREAPSGAEANAPDRSRPALPKPDYLSACPRCKSDDTKFCYYNNYNVRQPRFYCKACCRYWTEGGTLRNVRVGAGRRKTKSAAVREMTVPDARDTIDAVEAKVGNKRSRSMAIAEVARGGEAGVRRAKAPMRARVKRDGSSDGSATEAEQGNAYAQKWQNGSNDPSNTAARGASPEDHGSAEGRVNNRPNVKSFVGNTAAGLFPGMENGWSVDASMFFNPLLMTSGQAGQAQAAAAAAASAAIMSAATGWGMQFWNKSPMFPFDMQGCSTLGSQQSAIPLSTPISEAALKCDGMSHPTPLHPTPLHPTAAAYAQAPRMTPAQYPSMFQNPWAQFVQIDNKDYHSNPAAFQAMQQHMMNQQLAQFMHLSQFNMSGYGGTTTATISTAPTVIKQQIVEQVEPSPAHAAS